MQSSTLPVRRAEALLLTGLSRRPVLRASPSRTSVSVSLRAGERRRKLRKAFVVATYPEPETEKERSPLDYPQEWVTPQPSRRPDIFPEFEKLETPLPKPLPGDPEQPDEEEEIEKDKEKPKPEPEEDPEKDPEKETDEPELPES